MWIFNVYKFRESKNKEIQKYSPEFHKRMQITWVVTPILIGVILLAMSLPALGEFQHELDYNEVEEIREVVVEGTSSWQWIFYYEDEIALPQVDTNGISTTTLALEAGFTYKFILYSSGPLIHSFFVFDLSFKEDVVPGKNNTFTVTILEPGSYQILCAEYCGAKHSMMRGMFEVL